MEASRVTISKELLVSPMLSKKKKSKLKTEAVKDYIRSKPSGYVMSMAELMTAAGYDITRQYQSGYGFIKNMIKHGIIRKNDKALFSSWSIPGDSKTVSINEPKTHERVEADFTVGSSPIPKPTKQEVVDSRPTIGNSQTLYTIEKIVQNAKQFAWERNSDSLRDFIASLQ